MSKAQGAVAWAVAIANNPAHGYDQQNRWGPDYDCSSLVISAWEAVGVSVREAGASYTGNMRKAFLACGFRDVTVEVDLASGRGMQPGDVLLNEASHTALVVTEGRIVAARLNERGQTVGGVPGDQTGKEICQQSYYNYPWSCVLRYQERAAAADHFADSGNKVSDQQETVIRGLPTLSRGSKGWAVRSAQGALIAHGYSCGPDGTDGDLGYNTWNALVRFQGDRGLLRDGILGDETWTRLLLG